MESPNSLRPKKARQVKSKVKSMLIIFIWQQGDFHKKFILAGQTVISAHYCDVLWRLRENTRRFRPELWRQNNWLLHHENAPSHNFFFKEEFFTKNKMTPPTPFFCFTD
jgi:hypothetical protein